MPYSRLGMVRYRQLVNIVVVDSLASGWRQASCNIQQQIPRRLEDKRPKNYQPHESGIFRYWVWKI